MFGDSGGRSQRGRSESLGFGICILLDIIGTLLNTSVPVRTCIWREGKSSSRMNLFGMKLERQCLG